MCLPLSTVRLLVNLHQLCSARACVHHSKKLIRSLSDREDAAEVRDAGRLSLSSISTSYKRRRNTYRGNGFRLSLEVGPFQSRGGPVLASRLLLGVLKAFRQ